MALFTIGHLAAQTTEGPRCYRAPLESRVSRAPRKWLDGPVANQVPRHSAGTYFGEMVVVQAQVSWPVLPTAVGVNTILPVAEGTVDVTVTTPVVSAIVTPLTYFVAPGNE